MKCNPRNRLCHARLRQSIILASLLSSAGAFAACDQMSEARTARGVVYADQNANNRRDRFETGVPGVSVSNGCQVTVSDAGGNYALDIAPGQILFVSQPADYRVPVDDNNLPQFYYRYYPEGTAASFEGTAITWQWPVIEASGALPAELNFPLLPLESTASQFTAHAFADTQARSEEGEDMVREELVNTLLGNPFAAAFGITVGDVVYDTLSLYQRHKEMMGLMDIPQWYLPGNHDINFEAPVADLANETFKRHFGPVYYSFNYGDVHVVALNNVEYAGDGKEFAPSRSYRGRISEDQLSWLEQDLALVDKDKLIVIASHIPLVAEASDGSRSASGPGTENFSALLELLEPFENIYAMAGHDTSNSWKVEVGHEHGWNGKAWIAHTLAEVRGSGWTRGPRDARGVRDAIMADGNPNGYYLMHFDGNTVVPEFIPFPADTFGGQRMRVMLEPPLSNSSAASINRGNLSPGSKVIVNLFDGGSRDSVRLSLDGGEAVPMRYVLRNDPLVESLVSRFANGDDSYAAATISAHIWEYDLPESLGAGAHRIVVESEDEFGQRRRQGFSFEVL